MTSKMQPVKFKELNLLEEDTQLKNQKIYSSSAPGTPTGHKKPSKTTPIPPPTSPVVENVVLQMKKVEKKSCCQQFIDLFCRCLRKPVQNR